MKVGYARLSKKGDADANSIKAQVAALSTAGCATILTDADSGGNDQRPGWAQLKALIDAGTVSEIVTKDASRLGRDMAEVSSVLKLCRLKRVAVTFLSDPANSVSAGGNTSVHLKILVGLDEHYREEVRRKIGEGIANAQAAGKHRNRVPYGYARIDGKLHRHPTDWARAKELISTLERNRWSAHAALDQARAITERRWTASGLRNWILSPSLRGGVGVGQSKRGVYEFVHWGQHEPLLSEQQQRDARQSIEANRRHVGRGVKHRITGLTRCCHCGYACSVQSQQQRYRYARCNERDCVGHLKSVKADLVEQAVAQAIVRQVDIWMQQVVTNDLPKPVNPELQVLEEELMELRPLLRRGKKVYEQRAAELEAQINALSQMPQEDGSKRLQEFIAVWGGDIKAGEMRGWLEDEYDRSLGAGGVIGHVFRALVETVKIDGVKKEVVEVKMREAPILGMLMGAGVVPDGDAPALLHGPMLERLGREIERARLAGDGDALAQG